MHASLNNLREATPSKKIKILTRVCTDLRTQLTKAKVNHKSDKTKWAEERKDLLNQLKLERAKTTGINDLVDRLTAKDDEIRRLKRQVKVKKSVEPTPVKAEVKPELTTQNEEIKSVSSHNS